MAVAADAAAAPAAADAAAAAGGPLVMASLEAAYTPDAIESWSQHAAWCVSRKESNITAAAAPDAAAAASSMRDLIAVAMYEYDEATRSRTGGVSFYSVHHHQQGQQQTEELALRLALHHRTEAFGCLDTRWLCGHHCSGRCCSEMLPAENFESLLAVVGSDCALHAFRVSVHPREDEGEGSSSSRSSGSGSSSSSSSSSFCCSNVAEVALLRSPGRDHIGLGLDALHEQTHCIAATCSDGSAAVVSDLEFLSVRWKAHDAEAWAVAICPQSEGTLIATEPAADSQQLLPESPAAAAAAAAARRTAAAV
ncbi:hypothetical protein Efla_007800 [Eimeria flavescens]